ncbi:MAG: hypothetical protein ACRCSD_09790 [Clostridium sp.]
MDEVEVVNISPFNFLIDPMVTSIREASYCGYVTYKSVGEMIKMYSDKQEELINNRSNDIDDDLTYGKDTQNAKTNCYT